MTLVFSVAGLLISIVTLYLTQFNKPRIKIVIDNTILMAYNYLGYEYFELLMPVSMINNSSNSGVALRCAVCLINSNNGESNFMTWQKFYKVDFETGRYADDKLALPFVVGGHSSTSQIIMFGWDQSENAIRLSPGEYELKLYVWFSSNNNTKPDKMISRRFTINESQIKELKQSFAAAKKSESNPYTEFPLDNQLPTNQKLTAAERSRLYDV
jgi:hypothetical protein